MRLRFSASERCNSAFQGAAPVGDVGARMSSPPREWTPLYPCDAVFVDGLCTARDARRLRDALLPPPRGAEEARRAYADELAEAMLAQGARTFEVEPKYVDAFLASLMAGSEE
jgi:hypothetical protein